jgi:RNA polymerase sigma-70 factor (ECF subfamily)
LRDFGQDLVALLPRLRRFARGLTGHAAAADDLVQTACERAWASRAQFTAGTRLDHWVMRILRNAWLDGLRRQAVRGGPPLPIEELSDPPATDGYRTAEAALTLGRLPAALAALQPEQREVVLLVCVEGMTLDEAAGCLRIPPGTASSRLARGRVRLAELLGRLDESEAPRQRVES